MSELLGQLNFKKILFRGENIDQPTLEEAINHLANYLEKRIYSQSPFILLMAHTHIKTVAAYYAILKIGKIAVIVDPNSLEIELNETILDVDPCAIISLNTKNIKFDYDQEIIFRPLNKEFVVHSNLKDVCTLAYTNAEDGYSKGAMLTEKNLMSEIQAIKTTNRLNDNSVICALLPFSHLYGFVHGVLVITQAGGSGLIIELNLLQINNLISEIIQVNVSHLHTVPSVYYMLSKVPGIENMVKDIKELYSGGIQLSSFIFESFYNKTKRKIREGYGLTECSPAIAGNFQEDDPVLGSFGKPFPGCEIKILDEFGNERKAEQIGEICVKGDMVFRGYFNHENTTKIVLKDDWFYTGDLGKKDKNGYLYFCGLKKEMINTSGNKIYPKKLERLLKMHQNVLLANVFKEVSPLQGHVVGVHIKLHKTSINSQHDVKDWCYKNINNNLLPKTWHFE